MFYVISSGQSEDNVCLQIQKHTTHVYHLTV